MEKESEELKNQGSEESLGEFLNRERTERGVSLREISETTKVSVRYLEALERDDLEALPPRAFVIGFLRAYSECLKIDPQEAVARYERLSPRVKPGQVDTAQKESLGKEDSTLKRVVLLVFGGILVAVLFYTVFIRDWSPKAPKGPKAYNASSVGTKDGS